jgi:integrase
VGALAAPHRLIALLCYCCGLRISECVSLTLGDCNLTSRMLTVRQSKGSKGRQVPIPPELVPLIQARAEMAIKVCKNDLKAQNVVAPLSGLQYKLHPGSSREPGQWPLFFQNSLVWDHRVSLFVRVFLHASHVEKAFKKCRSKSGVLTRITPHRLRDAYAIHSLLAGVPINVIQQHMGHATVETTAKYLSFLLTPEGAKLFPGFDLFRNLNKSA